MLTFSRSLGKYVPAISYKIHKENEKGSNPRLPLKGLAIGDGLCDPINQLDYSDFLYETGLLDEGDRAVIEKFAKQTRDNIQSKNWKVASDVSKSLKAFGEVPEALFFPGFWSHHRLLQPKDPA